MKNRTMRWVAAASATVGVAAGSAHAAPLPGPGEKRPVLPARLVDVNGDKVVVRNTSRIVVLNGDVAEVVYALGLGNRVVATDISATYPAAAAAKQRIGYQRTLSAEGILALKPTLVIGNTMAGPPAVIQQIRSAGVTTVILPDSDRLSASWTKIRNVGRALGVPRRANRLAEITRRQVAAARRMATRSTSTPKVAFLYLRGPRTQLIGGIGSRGDVMIKAAGGIDVGASIGIRGFQPITAEALITAAPDYIVVPQAGLDQAGGVNGVLRLPGIAQTPAGRARRIYGRDDQWVLGLGPRTGSAVRALAVTIHPELQRR